MECKCAYLINWDTGNIELIDTLWNVNLFATALYFLVFRINRYIMECKFVLMQNGVNRWRRINRYIMECK